MSWTYPRTWSPSETETAAIFNQAVRDNMLLLKTSQDDTGVPKLCYRNWGYSGAASAGVNSNAAGAGDTELTAYTTVLPASLWTTYGETLTLLGVWNVANNANTKTIKIEVGGVKATIYARATAVASCVMPMEVHLGLRLLSGGSSPQLIAWGALWSDAAAGGAPSPMMFNVTMSSLSSAFTTALTLKVYAASTTASDLVLTEGSLILGHSAIAGGNP